MLINFSVSNFLSFKDLQRIDLTPDSLKEHSEFLHVPYLFDYDERLLKSVAIFGHNSHGKTNFLKAYEFFLNFIFKSFSFNRAEETINIESFKLNSENIDKPSEFETSFYLKNFRYRYGFKITAKEVVEEWLFYSESKLRENYLFIRGGSEIKISKLWNKESDIKIEQAYLFTKKHHLLLSVLIAQGNIPRIKEIEKWFRGNTILSQLTYSEQINRSVLIYSHSDYRSLINRFIESADLGFTSIVEKIDSHLNKSISLEKNFLELWFERELNDFELYSQHTIYNDKYQKEGIVLFELLKSESSGTIKFFILVCLLTYAIKKGQLVIIDELDSHFHSQLLMFLITKYNDSKINNLGSQLIFTSHNTILLNSKLLRRDQIVFVEKNEYGESFIRKMHTSKTPIRIDTSIEKEYIKGKLGGTSKNLNYPNSNLSFEF
jgi:hypothetical protein